MFEYEVIYQWNLMHQAKTYVKASSLNEARDISLAKYGKVLSIVQVSF